MTPVSGIQGLNKDQTFQTPNQVTFALNAIRDSHDGGKPEYQSEPGNEIVGSLPNGYFLLGWIYGQDNSVYLFSTNESLSEIGKFKQGVYTTLVNADLGFNRNYPITGEFRLKNGCDPIIYWWDHFNPDRFFNENRPDDFQTSSIFDPNKFRLDPIVLPPDIDIVQVNNSGGNTQLGSYWFQLEYLDESDNQIYTSDITPQTVIYDDATNAPYYNIDGGLNTPQYDPAIGGIPITNKSITLVFSNLNTSFSNLRVNVFYAVTGNSVISGHSVGTLIPITSDTITWTYTGYNPSAGDFPIDISEKLVINNTYESAYVGEQVQNSLVRANLKQNNKDYSQYQQYASQVTATWVSKEVKMDDNTIIGNPKYPNTYWYGRGFMGDEVYLLGIRYLHKDGTWSPVLPLIGREAIFFDTQLLTVVDNSVPSPTSAQVWLSDVDHLDLNIGDTVERWKVFNTATITTSNTVTHPYDYEGTFGYYELDTTYPDIRDCDDNSIWGTVSPSDKVRLFKFPDRRLLSHIDQTGEYILPLGIKFDNIIYPNSDVIAHQFMFADRTNTLDKTVLDSGWMVRPTEPTTDTIIVDGYVYHDNTQNHKYVRFNSAKSLFDSELFNFDHYKLNRVHYLQSQVVPSPADFTETTLTGGDILQTFIAYMNSTQNVVPLRTNHEEVKTVRLDSGTELTSITGFDDLQSVDFFTHDSFSSLTYQLENTTGLLPAQARRLDQDDTDIQINLHNFYAYKKANIQPYSNFLSRIFKYINHNPVYSTLSVNNEFYGGDTLISECTDFRYKFEADDGTTYVYTLPFYQDHYEEHEINTALRHEGTEIQSQYFKVGKSDDYVVSKLSDNAERYLQDNTIREYYKYNPDYDINKLELSKLPLPNSYNYCSQCVGYFPHRIIWSPKSFDEESFDFYRVFNTNDYIDLPGHTGAITGLKYMNNQLLVHTENSTYILQPNPQQIQTDQNTAYLGTGDFLSVPPIELVPVNIGYAGCQSKQHQCETPYGHCWIDQKRGEIFRFDSKLERMVDGLEQWLREFLPSELQSEYYRVYGEQYPIKVTTHKDGIGCILYYDPRFKRLLITKQEFLPIELLNPKDNPSQSYQTIYEGRWIQATTGSPITYGNPTYFINKSWTLSYAFEFNSSEVKPFVSWHSYRPYQAFNDSNNFYTLNRFANGTYRHKHKQSYQRFYNTKYDFIVEYQVFDLSTDRLSSVHYVGYTYEWDSTNEDWLLRDKTFDRILCYNNNQSTGLQTVNLLTSPYQNVFLPNNSKYVIKTDQNYKIAGLVDYSTNQPVMTKSWTQLQTYPSYIDRVPNTTNIDFTKSAYIQGKLWDKFVNVRLFFKPAEDYKKIIILSSVNEQESIR